MRRRKQGRFLAIDVGALNDPAAAGLNDGALAQYLRLALHAVAIGSDNMVPATVRLFVKTRQLRELLAAGFLLDCGATYRLTRWVEWVAPTSAEHQPNISPTSAEHQPNISPTSAEHRLNISRARANIAELNDSAEFAEKRATHTRPDQTNTKPDVDQTRATPTRESSLVEGAATAEVDPRELAIRGEVARHLDRWPVIADKLDHLVSGTWGSAMMTATELHLPSDYAQSVRAAFADLDPDSSYQAVARQVRRYVQRTRPTGRPRRAASQARGNRPAWKDDPECIRDPEAISGLLRAIQGGAA